MIAMKRVALCFMILVISFALCSCARNEGDESAMGTGSDIQIRTDTNPIYNHFPTLPETDRIEWYSISSEGIGLTTIKLYIFAYYDSAVEIEGFLQNVTLANDDSDIDFILRPESVTQNETWHEILEVPFCFQEDIPNTELMNTKVYVNSSHTSIYIEAIGEG